MDSTNGTCPLCPYCEEQGFDTEVGDGPAPTYCPNWYLHLNICGNCALQGYQTLLEQDGSCKDKDYHKEVCSVCEEQGYGTLLEDGWCSDWVFHMWEYHPYSPQNVSGQYHQNIPSVDTPVVSPISETPIDGKKLKIPKGYCSSCWTLDSVEQHIGESKTCAMCLGYTMNQDLDIDKDSDSTSGISRVRTPSPTPDRTLSESAVGRTAPQSPSPQTSGITTHKSTSQTTQSEIDDNSVIREVLYGTIGQIPETPTGEPQTLYQSDDQYFNCGDCLFAFGRQFL